MRVIAVCIVILLGCAAPAGAWLFEGDVPQYLGVSVKDGGSADCVAALFDVQEDSYATSFGLALARISGPAGSGFTVYLTESPYGLPDSALATFTMTPLNATLQYYDVQPDSPILLQAGTVYALVAEPNSPTFWGSVSYARLGYYGESSGDGGTTWSTLPYPLCVRVDGYSAVPEPSGACVLALGLGGVLARRRPRRNTSGRR